MLHTWHRSKIARRPAWGQCCPAWACMRRVHLGLAHSWRSVTGADIVVVVDDHLLDRLLQVPLDAHVGMGVDHEHHHRLGLHDSYLCDCLGFVRIGIGTIRMNGWLFVCVCMCVLDSTVTPWFFMRWVLNSRGMQHAENFQHREFFATSPIQRITTSPIRCSCIWHRLMPNGWIVISLWANTPYPPSSTTSCATATATVTYTIRFWLFLILFGVSMRQRGGQSTLSLKTLINNSTFHYCQIWCNTITIYYLSNLFIC